MSESLSLRSQFAAFHAERERSFTPEALRLNVTQRQELVEHFDAEAAVKAGDLIEPFTIETVDGTTLTLDDLIAGNPAVLLFFRFSGCPACNIALPHYDRTLYPALAARRVPLVAISPQSPDKLRDIAERHALGFPVATDRGNSLARRFGLLFEPNEENKAASTAAGNFIGDVTGTGTWELPYPSVIVIGADRRVTFAAISPDWLDRAESSAILDAVDVLLPDGALP